MNSQPNKLIESNWHSSPRLFIEQEDILYFATSEELQKRKNAWNSFFEEYQHGPFCFYTITIQALELAFEKSDLIKEQTAHEFELSKAFYRSIVELKLQTDITTQNTAHKLLYLSLIFGKYPGMFLKPIHPFFKELNSSITESMMDELFQYLLVRYETPHYLIKNFNYLNCSELDLLMHALNGKNMRNHEVFLVRPTKKEFSKIMQLKADGLMVTDHHFLRGLIYLKMEELEIEEEKDFDFFQERQNGLIGFMKASLTFLNSPDIYLIDIEFWKKGFRLIYEFILDGAILSITDCVDYLEHMKYHSDQNYSLKGRTKESLSRAILNWHNHIFQQDNNSLKEMHWEKTKELDVYFSVNNKEFCCIQLTSGNDLYKEGKFMQNCVITYAYHCSKNHCTIWSLRKKIKTKYNPFLTIEVIENKIVQARQKGNEMPSEQQLDILHDWAKRMDYKIDLFKNE